ncbi:hypothetical protein P692DRAFT_20881110 [Suillus brevipes Sb2]|nr:hypothetical protein P692DRAFT_20881110 [Suillus brevipes Sb2]
MSNLARNVFVESLTFKYNFSEFHCHPRPPRPADCDVGKLITVTKARVVCFNNISQYSLFSDGKISTESTHPWKRTRPYFTQELILAPASDVDRNPGCCGLNIRNSPTTHSN